MNSAPTRALIRVIVLFALMLSGTIAAPAATLQPMRASAQTAVATAPTVVITSHPDNPTRQTAVSFSFSNDSGVSYSCLLASPHSDGSAEACTSPKGYSLTDGDGGYTFTVRATDALSNTSQASYSFTLDTTAPIISITSKPSDPTNKTTAEFVFSPNESATMACALTFESDPTTFEACSSPASYTLISGNGPYTFRVRATDPAGNVGQAAYTFTLDTIAPGAPKAYPPGGMYSEPQSVTLSTGDTSASIYYTTDGSDPSNSSTRNLYSTAIVVSQTTTIKAVAIDQAGNNSSIASHTYTLDSSPPVVTITGHPDEYTTQTTAKFTFEVNKGADLKCSLAPGAPTFEPCTSPMTYSLLSGDGSYKFTVRATDTAGNTGEASYTFHLDRTAPAAPSIPILAPESDTGPQDGAVTRATTPIMTGSTEPGALVQIYAGTIFVGKGTADASGIYKVTISTLATNTSYAMSATATDRAGNLGPASSTGLISIDSTAPSVTERSPAPNATDVALNTRVTASFNEDVSGFNSTSFALKQGTSSVASAVSYDSAKKTATLAPNSNLGAGASYTAELGSGITDLAGNALSAASWSFSTASNNLLANPSFELDANGDNRPDSWSSNANFTRSNAIAARQGSSIGRHRSTSNVSYSVTQRVNVTADTDYTFAGWVNIPATSDAFTFDAELVWKNSSNATIGSANVVRRYSAATSGWNQFSGTLTAPTGAVAVIVRMDVSSLNATVYVDDFSFTPGSSSTPPPATPQPPAAPSGLSASAGDGQVSLSWTAVSDATSYNVKRATVSGGPYSTVASPTGTSFINTGLANGTTYYYVVTAVNSGGESNNSNQASATPSGTTTPPPSTNLLANPGFELDANGDNRPDSWSSNSNFTHSDAIAAHSGSFVGRHRSTSNVGYSVTQRVDVTAGAAYTFAGWVNIPATSDAFALEAEVVWKDAANATIGKAIEVKRYTAATSGWNQFSSTLTAPSGAVAVMVRMDLGSLNATVYVDDWSFTQQ